MLNSRIKNSPDTMPTLKEHSQRLHRRGISVVNDYADTHFHTYLRENEKFRITVFAFSNGAAVEFLD